LGATKVEQVLSNARAAEWVLTDEELGEIRSILEPEF
jgi:aryl-alcohol dehydrogenase-like predicted oxidoreductase